MSLPTPTSGAVYNAANELTQWNGVNLTYDANGNLTGDGLNNYTWNERNQLATVKDANNGATLASFVYDPFGRRLQNSAGDGVLYDGANEAQELSGTTPVVNRLTGGVDEFFAWTDSAGTTFPLTDALGSTIALTDSTGTVQTQYTYDPFGGVTAAGAMSTNVYQFTGRVNDGTGLYYYRARYYSPRFQRFISEDPIEFAGGVNLYAYVGGDPVDRIDPLGLCWFYSQSTGNMYHITLAPGSLNPGANARFSIEYAGTGYSGLGDDYRNKPAAQYVHDKGPIPQGSYTIGPEQTNQISAACGPDGTPRSLANSMRSTPNPFNDMGGRSGFLIHQGNMKTKTSSKGCIVLPLEVINTIGKSDDNCLGVVP